MNQKSNISITLSDENDEFETLHSELVHLLGLTSNEAKAYIHLLSNDTITPSLLSKITGIHRSRIYDNLKGLESKGLISKANLEPLSYRIVPPELAITQFLEQLNKSHASRVFQISALSISLQSLHNQIHTQFEQPTTKLIPLKDVITELSELIEDAKIRVWVSKRTLGGVVDWYVLRSQLDQLVSSNVDIKFISDTSIQLPYVSRLLSEVPLSFALVDNAVMTFLFSSSLEVDQVIVSRNKQYVEFFTKLFSELWSATECRT